MDLIHKQKHRIFGSFCSSTTSMRYNLNPVTHEIVLVSPLVKCDQFFSEEHNKRNGYISTNPELAASASSVGHFQPTSAETPLSSDMTDNDIFNNIVPRNLQTISELQKLVKFRPVETDYIDGSQVDPPVDSPVEPGIES